MMMLSEGGVEVENLYSKDHNEYFYKLIRIFGYNDEPIISFIDKDKMKK
jgi:hypothetical protein